MTKIAVVALGGNALTQAGQSGTYDEMVANAAAMATAAVALKAWMSRNCSADAPAGEALIHVRPPSTVRSTTPL